MNLEYFDVNYPTNFTADWFTADAEGWLRMLGHLRNVPAQGLEIGSYEGRSAHWLLSNILTHPESRLTCIDTWDGGDCCLNVQTITAERAFDSNLAAFSNMIKRKGDSRYHLIRMSAFNRLFDFIFIDGDHEGHGSLTDLVLAWPLVKPGGWLAFDDYGWDGAGYNLRSLPRDAFDAWLSVKPPGLGKVEPVGRLMFAQKES